MHVSEMEIFAWDFANHEGQKRDFHNRGITPHGKPSFFVPKHLPGTNTF
jgi:hypothetical protein